MGIASFRGRAPYWLFTHAGQRNFYSEGSVSFHVDYSKLGKLGILINGLPSEEGSGTFAETPTAGLLSALEQIGYSAVWVASLEPETLGLVEKALEVTTRIAVGPGIANIWLLSIDEIAAFHRNIAGRFPGRLLLGVGAGHAEHIGAEHRKPYSAVAAYLEGLRERGVPGTDIVLGALRSRTLQLSAEQSAGAIPAWMPLEHTRYARRKLGPGKFLATTRAVVFEEDPIRAREIARPTVDFYGSLANYFNAWQQFGFPQIESGAPASDQLIDAVVAHGSPAQIAADLREQFASGADHVAIYPLAYNPGRLEEFSALAKELSPE